MLVNQAIPNFDVGHDPTTRELRGARVLDDSNRRRTPKDYAVWEIDPVIKLEVIQ